MKRRPSSNNRQPGDGMLATIATRLRGVMGSVQERNDVVLVGSYEQDREVCERAIESALAELEEAEDEFDLAWKWKLVDDAYCRLAHVVSRAALARRRADVKRAEALEAQKQRERSQLP